MNRIGPRPLRVLLVANADRSRLQGRWYSTEYKLRNGLIRAGHMVLFFSERDVAREASPLPTKKFGVRAMIRRLIETARHFLPDLVLFGHADLCDGETFAALRSAAPGVRLAQVNVDPTHRPKTMAAFAQRGRDLDRSFITTGDPDALARLGLPGGTVHFMPNPVDAAIETARVFDNPRGRLDWDGLFLGTGIEKRGEQLEHLARSLPGDYRFHYGARAAGEDMLTSTAFLRALETGAACPNLPLDDSQQTPRLYSSDRIAQLLGQGVLAFCHAPAQLSNLYGEGVVEWSSREALIEAMLRHMRDDETRRRIAGTGWRVAHERTSAERVACALVETAMEWPHTQDYGWPVDALA